MKRVIFVTAAFLAAVLALALLRAPAGASDVVVYRAWTKADLVDVAAVHSSKLDKSIQPYLRYVDLSEVPPGQRAEKLGVLGYVVNSWSRNDLLAAVKAVGGTQGALAYFNLADLRERDDHKGLAALVLTVDRLGRLGSGPDPQPEPNFHKIVTTPAVVTKAVDRVEEYQEWVDTEYKVWDRYRGQWVQERKLVTRTRTVKGMDSTKKAERVLAIATHLHKATAIGLATLTASDFPIFEYHWLVYNGLVEPRYHELLGLDDTEASAKKLAAVDEKTAEKIGAQLRGAVLFSDVAHHNRILERTPTAHRYGRGTYWESYDFKTSVNLQDVLKNVLITGKDADAKEIIFTIPNGLQGFFVVDNKEKRLDKADGDVANNKRSKFRDTQVRTAYMCIACHLPDKGWIEMDDGVRALASKPIKLLADSFKGSDKKRGDQIRQKYLQDDINELLKLDQLLVDGAVKRATGGLDSATTARSLTNSIYDYLEGRYDVAALARKTGYTTDEVEAVLGTEGLDPVFAIIAIGRKGRRDQIESGFNQLATVLYLAKVKKEH